nr:hypothetical protein [uncultured Albidiferax sp.]
MLGDKEYVSYQLEAMKMAQATLQQIMTLSAGGLALFFSFIAKAPFASSMGILGPGVVIAWSASLCAAAYAHRLHSILFLAIARLYVISKQVNELEALPGEVELALKSTLNQEAVLESASAKIEAERTRVSNALNEFEQSFFPTQSKAINAVRFALAVMVLGFVLLGIAYVLAHYNLTFLSSRPAMQAAYVRH